MGRRLSDDEVRVLAMIDQAATVEEIGACVDAYYDELDNPVGGSLHIVLDDRNYRDEDVRYCIEYAEATFIPGRGAIPDAHKETDPVGAALGRKLLALSEAERAAANGDTPRTPPAG